MVTNKDLDQILLESASLALREALKEMSSAADDLDVADETELTSKLDNIIRDTTSLMIEMQAKLGL